MTAVATKREYFRTFENLGASGLQTFESAQWVPAASQIALSDLRGTAVTDVKYIKFLRSMEPEALPWWQTILAYTVALADLKRPDATRIALGLVTELKNHGKVEKILVNTVGNTVRIWIVANRIDDAERDAIYECEWNVLQAFGHPSVEFNLIDRDNGQLQDIIGLNLNAQSFEVH